MVSPALSVVVADHPFFVDDVGQGVFIAVRFVRRPGYFPDLDFDSVAVLIGNFGALYRYGFHDWYYMPV
jgi:hypothetical protein